MVVNTPKQSAPLNFRTSNSLVTTRVPHYATKTKTANSSVPGLHRPNTNGIPSNINQDDFKGPEFKARPIKHWRRQHVPTAVANAMNTVTGVITNPEESDTLIKIPEDIVAIRSKDISENLKWRRKVREEFINAFENGGKVVGFSANNEYVVRV